MVNYTQNPQNEDKRKPSYFDRNRGMIRVVSVAVMAVLILLIVIGACIGCYFGGKSSAISDNIKDDLAIANEVYTLIKEHYYKDISKEEFNKWAAVGLATAMDQYSNLSYSSTMPSPQFGISIKSDSYNNHVISDISKSSNPLLPTPAESAVGNYLDGSGTAKLERGDVIISVDDKSVSGLNTDVLTGEQFLGKASLLTPIKIVVEKSDGRRAEFNIKKALFSTKNVEYQDFGNGIGYIKLSSFTGDAATEFANCAESFRGGSKLILDLRDNGGGSVDILGKIASYLIHDKNGKSNGLEVIKLASEKENKYSYCTAVGDHWLGIDKNNNLIDNFKLVVLVNENSASASEALLGAIKYYCSEATIIGSPTYGKGIAQQTYGLTSTADYVLSITIGHFYVPVDNGGVKEWKTFHGQSMLPSADNLKISKFSDQLDFVKDEFYKDYYNNDIKQEKAIRLALQVLR